MVLSKLVLICGLSGVAAQYGGNGVLGDIEGDMHSSWYSQNNSTTTTTIPTTTANATTAAPNTTMAPTTAAATTAAATTAAATTAANGTTAAGAVQGTDITGLKNSYGGVPCEGTCAANATRRMLQTAAQSTACGNYVDLVLNNAAAKTEYANKMKAVEPLASNAATCEVTAVTLSSCAFAANKLTVTAAYTLRVTPKAGVTNAALQTAVTAGTTALQTAAVAAGKASVTAGVNGMSDAQKTTLATSIGKTAADINAAFATAIADTVTADASGVTVATVTFTTAAPAASSAVSAAFGMIVAMFSAALLF